MYNAQEHISNFTRTDIESDLYDILPNPDKFDENDPDIMLNNVVSQYYAEPDLNSLLDQQNNNKALTFFHCNIRSLPKNMNLVNELLLSLTKTPDILAVTETRLIQHSVENVEIYNYNFYHTDSKTPAGGAGIYVSKCYKVTERPDLKLKLDLVESCWIEVDTGIKQRKPIIIGCIYRHPKSNLELFTNRLEETLRFLNQSKYDVFILGDINVDLYKYATHNPSEKYLDMLFSNNMTPIITKPTRLTDHSETLIDHIYTNSTLRRYPLGLPYIISQTTYLSFVFTTHLLKRITKNNSTETTNTSTRSYF